MAKPLHVVALTAGFLADCHDAGLEASERDAIIDAVARAAREK